MPSSVNKISIQESDNLKNIEDHKIRKVFIFGASGFIGNKLNNYLETKHKTVTVGRNEEDIYYDLLSSDPEILSTIISEGDVWVFLAAISSPEKCAELSENAFAVNVVKTIQLIEWLTERYIKVIYSSSDAVFGNKNYICSDYEGLDSYGDYGFLKEQVENAVSHNHLVKVIRFSYVLDKEDKFTRMLYDAEKTGLTVDIFKGFERNIVLLQDVLVGIENLINKWEELDFYVTNFSGPELLSRQDLVKTLKEYVIHNLKFTLSEASESFWKNRAKSIATDNINFTKILGHKPQKIFTIKEIWKDE
jgi:dTDP-4-dehydrorhamnose reductase